MTTTYRVTCYAQALAAARVEELLAIEEVSVGVTLVCPGPDCGKRFAAHRAVKGRFCSTVCAETPRSDRRTVVVNGIEYVAQSVGGNYFNEVVVDAPHQGSSLSGGSFQVRR